MLLNSTERQVKFPELNTFADLFHEVVGITGHTSNRVTGSQTLPPEPEGWQHTFTMKDLFASDESWQRLLETSASLQEDWLKPTYVGPYISVQRRGGIHHHQSGYARIDRAFAEQVLRHTIHVPYSTMTWEVIEWPDNQALVIAQHGQIIGGVWVACIRADSIPTWPERPAPFHWYADRNPTSPYGVVCTENSLGEHGCGKQGLSEEEYLTQLSRADTVWLCPVCQAHAHFDEARAEEKTPATPKES